jgi:hypothetical protein
VEEAEGRCLTMTIDKHWFREIAYGNKREEYRYCNKTWENRLRKPNWHIDRIVFRNGYLMSALHGLLAQ